MSRQHRDHCEREAVAPEPDDRLAAEAAADALAWATDMRARDEEIGPWPTQA